jgi:hypothetical protein
MAGREGRDERRRLELIRQRKRLGRRPGLTPVRRHPKRFEAVIWLSFRKALRFSYIDAGRLTFLLLRHKGPFELLDVGHGYALWRGQDPFSQHDEDPLSRHYRDLKATALELVKRSEANADDRFWLNYSITTFAALWCAARQSHDKPAAVGMALLIKLGWPRDFLLGICERLATLPTHATPAPPPLVEAFERSARKYRFSVAKNLTVVSRR